VNTLRVSEAETEKELSALMQDYDLGLSDREYERSAPKLKFASEYRHLHHSPPSQSPLPPPLAMDISSVRFRPVPVVAQAEITSTYGHPRLNWPEMAKVNMVAVHLFGIVLVQFMFSPKYRSLSKLFHFHT